LINPKYIGDGKICHILLGDLNDKYNAYTQLPINKKMNSHTNSISRLSPEGIKEIFLFLISALRAAERLKSLLFGTIKGNMRPIPVAAKDGPIKDFDSMCEDSRSRYSKNIKKNGKLYISSLLTIMFLLLAHHKLFVNFGLTPELTGRDET
jgi:hypothetical protein